MFHFFANVSDLIQELCSNFQTYTADSTTYVKGRLFQYSDKTSLSH